MMFFAVSELSISTPITGTFADIIIIRPAENALIAVSPKCFNFFFFDVSIRKISKYFQ